MRTWSKHWGLGIGLMVALALNVVRAQETAGTPPATSPPPPPANPAPAAPSPSPSAAPTPAPASAPGTSPVPPPAVVEATPAAHPVPPADVSAVAPAPLPAAPVIPIPASVTPGEGAPAAAVEADGWARPFFVKGDLDSFAVRPMTQRNFIGIGAGISALPRDSNTVLNSYYLTVEPQIDISNPNYHWKLGLGAPLQFEMLDTRGAFEVCVAEGRNSRLKGGDENQVAADATSCVARQRDRATQNMGQLRKADWDSASDFAKIIRYAIVGGQEQPFYLSIQRLYDQSMGHGTVIRHYNPNIDYNTARLGANLDFNRAAVGLQAMTNDLVRPDVLGLMGFVRPLRPYSEDVLLRSLSVGVSWVHGVNQPRTLQYEPGLFTPSFGQPIPKVDSSLRLVGGEFDSLNVMGFDVEGKLIRTQVADMKLYVDYQKMSGHGGGTTLGSLWRFSFGQPAWQALRARAEVNYFDADYMPNYFDTWHDIFAYQYIPGAYKGSNGLTYHPTKLAYLEASHGGRHRVGGYLELTHSLLNYMTLGVTFRGWTPIGAPSDPNFVAPAFADYDQGCTDKGNGDLSCARTITMSKEHGFSSLRLHAEFPFRRFLQAFANYEVFSTTAENGLGVFRLNGDNEVFFSGARLMILPFFFIEAQARRYFFLQRVNNVNLETLTLQQDQTYHSNWTFALNAFVGYEF